MVLSVFFSTFPSGHRLSVGPIGYCGSKSAMRTIAKADVVREAVASGKPCVINAIVQGGKEVLAEPFRRDALRKPVHYLPKYAHLNVAAQSDSLSAAYN